MLHAQVHLHAVARMNKVGILQEGDGDGEVFHDARSSFGPARGGNHSHVRSSAMVIMLTSLMAYAPSPLTAFKRMEKDFEHEAEVHGIKRPRRMLQNLYKRVVETGNWVDRPRSGRPEKLTEDQVRLCVIAFKQGVGNKRHEDWCGYTSIEHAAAVCTIIQRVLRDSRVTVDTMWERMCVTQLRDYGKKFTKINIIVKPALRDEIKKERLSVAREWCAWSADDFDDIFWIDEKTEYHKCTRYECYAGDDDVSYAVESHSTLGKAKKLKYIACVNAVLGPVYFKLISGASDYDSGFKVRTCVPMP